VILQGIVSKGLFNNNSITLHDNHRFTAAGAENAEASQREGERFFNDLCETSAFSAPAAVNRLSFLKMIDLLWTRFKSE